ncbi:MAG: hypothetical protein GX160_00050 [Clostridiales bacterium]|nr:hypothetical protein [Clostridiales bacterium]
MNKELIKKYPYVYALYGIYVDWQIDRNIILSGKDPHGIDSFEAFLNKDDFSIVIVTFNGKKTVSIDLNLEYYQQFKRFRINTDSILASNIKGMDAENLLREFSEEKNLPILEI